MELQDKLAIQGIQFAKAVRWADRQAEGASPGRRDPNDGAKTPGSDPAEHPEEPVQGES